ncbi:MAG: DUF4111 domain-containing protein [Anaerolineales bacterium]|nr:DUF4111 domain-containing protein [Anaerolineales bacterium]
MKTTARAPIPYPEINTLLHELLSNVQSVLGKHFIGLYVYGSLASGDFNPGRSDVDFVVITDGELPEEMHSTLESMHARITGSGLKWASKLEGSYIPQAAIRRYDPSNARHPALRMDGTFDVDFHGSDWIIQSHMIREQGIALAGPNPQILIDPVEPEDLRQAVLGTLHEWWEPQLDDITLLRSNEYQAYAVLTMCRMLYTLEFGKVNPKTAAAKWAQQTLGERWAPLIEEALAWQRGMKLDKLNETLELIQYTLEQSIQL